MLKQMFIFPNLPLELSVEIDKFLQGQYLRDHKKKFRKVLFLEFLPVTASLAGTLDWLAVTDFNQVWVHSKIYRWDRYWYFGTQYQWLQSLRYGAKQWNNPLTKLDC